MKGWKAISLLLVFLLTAITTANETDSYLLTPFRISSCALDPPRPGDVLVWCWGKAERFYYSGSIFLNIDRDLIGGLKAADVVVLGNSRTNVSFRAPSIARYFKSKGLRYFILANDGSGFRFSQLMLENVGARPKILLVNNESFFVDVLEDTYRDFVQSPDRFYPAFASLYYTRKFHDMICRSSFEAIKRLYCDGKRGDWRSTIDGTAYGFEDGPNRIPVVIPPETRMIYKASFMANAREFLASPAARSSCLIDYIVPSNGAAVELARSMAADLRAPFVFPRVDGLFSFDGSHLVPESSERWAAEFVKALDPAIDGCLARP
jgi:hypothetical protein